MLARCQSCGNEFVHVSGVAATEAQIMTAGAVLPRPVVITGARMSLEGPPLQSEPRVFHLTDIQGIAEPRARQLIAIGIDSVEKLAAATPEKVREIKFITRDMASKLIEQAKSLVG